MWPGSSQWFGLCGWDLVSCLWFSLCGRAWMVQAVWPGSSELLGWFRLGLVSCLGGSGGVAWVAMARV